MVKDCRSGTKVVHFQRDSCLASRFRLSLTLKHSWQRRYIICIWKDESLQDWHGNGDGWEDECLRGVINGPMRMRSREWKKALVFSNEVAILKDLCTKDQWRSDGRKDVRSHSQLLPINCYKCFRFWIFEESHRQLLPMNCYKCFVFWIFESMRPLLYFTKSSD